MKSKRPETSAHSTGRGTRMRHSTGMDWDEWARKRRIYPVKYSTGEDGRIVHSTGVEFDKKVAYRRKKYGDYKARGARHPGFTYKHYRKTDKSQSGNERKVSPKSLKKVIIEY